MHGRTLDPDGRLHEARAGVAAGARVLFPLADHDYGYRQGRLVDPFGHMWTVSTKLEGKRGRSA